MLHNEVNRYLAHKLHLAETSFYYKDPALKASIDWAYSMQQFLRFKGKLITERELALMLQSCKMHIEKLLPCENNKSYKSSVQECQKIITHCSELLQPKKQQNGNNNENQIN